MTATGYYGKLPDRGDFVSGGISPVLEQEIHQFGEALIAKGRDQHGEGFADRFAEMPLYAIMAQTGAVIDQAIAGLFGPSADAVGRLFPFFALTEHPEQQDRTDPTGYTTAAKIVDVAAFDKTPLTDVEAQLSELQLTIPHDVKGLWLSPWSVDGPMPSSRQFANLHEACKSRLDHLLERKEAL